MSEAEFKEDVIEKFGEGAFDFSEMNYVNSQTPVVLICTTHKTRHKIYPYDVRKLVYGCTDCRNDALRAQYTAPPETFLKKARAKHGDRYDYSEANYKGSHTKVVIRCADHGTFEQTPASHLSGRGCPECGKAQMAQKKRTKTTA